MKKQTLCILALMATIGLAPTIAMAAANPCSSERTALETCFSQNTENKALCKEKEQAVENCREHNQNFENNSNFDFHKEAFQ